ncbi:hypothetical protein FGB62_17g221 [Gracilaria domingensis]|nr:hypothetical protein FGB62_17g221 [Gracilaria domingensis]
MAQTESSALQNSVLQLIRSASESVSKHTQASVNSLKVSQLSLETELRKLDTEMQRITNVLETVTLDPHASELMEQTRQCLGRTKTKLITIRGRLGRLKTYEECDRLELNSHVSSSKSETPVLDTPYWEDTPRRDPHEPTGD